MKIAYLSTFYPFRGGIAQFNASLYNALAKQGHSVEAYTFTTQYPSFLFPGETQMVKDGDNAEIIDSQRIINSANPFSYPFAAKKVKKSQPDVLIMKYWMSYFGPSLGYVAGKLSKDAVVITILDNVIPHEKKFFDKAFTKYFLKRNTAFVAMSEKVKNDLLSLMPEAKHRVIPHPLYNHFGNIEDKIQAREKIGIKPDKKTLLFFGFIRDYKGLDLLIDAFAELDESYQLLIAGEVYGSFDKYNNLIKNNPRKDDIHAHVKYISDAEVPLYFSAADLCILPYKSATQSGITGISYHFELPMIATDVGGLAEIIHHKKTGLIVKQALASEISKTIKEYFAGDYHQDCVMNIRELKKSLSWGSFAEQITDFVNELKIQ